MKLYLVHAELPVDMVVLVKDAWAAHRVALRRWRQEWENTYHAPVLWTPIEITPAQSLNGVTLDSLPWEESDDGTNQKTVRELLAEVKP